MVARVLWAGCFLPTLAETPFNNDITDIIEHFEKDRSLLIIYNALYLSLDAYENLIIFAFVRHIVTSVL